MTDLQVSVIIPVHNGEKYLHACIESVLAQCDVEKEILVVNDGSTDGSASIANSFAGVRLIHQAKSGVGAARNLGFQYANAELIAYLDADDIWHPFKLFHQVSLFHSIPTLDVVGANIEEFLSDDLSEAEKSNLFARPGFNQASLPSAILLRRSAFEKIGGFSESECVGDAMDFALRIKELRLLCEVAAGSLVYRRIHLKNLTGTTRALQKQRYMVAIKHSLNRRRQNENK